MFRTFLSIIPLLPVYPGVPISQRQSSTKQQQQQWQSIFFFSISRGCRQGDPLSPYIFILSNKIRNNKSIKGMHINQSEHTISQYADDTSVFLDGSEKSLNELEDFAYISGLKNNFEKTQLVWIDSKKFDTSSIKLKWKLLWGKQTFKLLSINFNTDFKK